MAKLYINGVVVRECPEPKREKNIHDYITRMRKIYISHLRRTWFRNHSIDLKHLIEFDDGLNYFINRIPKRTDGSLVAHRVVVIIDGKRYDLQMHDETLGVKYTQY